MSLPSVLYPWFAVNVKPRHEKVVAQACEGKGFVNFLPLYLSHHRSGGRIRPVLLPLFPSYLFCSFDPLWRLPVLTIPGVTAIVMIGRVPAPIPTAELEAVDALIHSGVPLHPWPFVEFGDYCHIEYGPLRGLEGILIASKPKDRLVLSIPLLQRSVSVEVDRSWIRPTKMPAQEPGRQIYVSRSS